MHMLVAIGILAGLIWYAIGETAARVFVGVVLAIGAAVLLFAIGIVALDTSRTHEPPKYVRMGSLR